MCRPSVELFAIPCVLKELTPSQEEELRNIDELLSVAKRCNRSLVEMNLEGRRRSIEPGLRIQAEPLSPDEMRIWRTLLRCPVRERQDKFPYLVYDLPPNVRSHLLDCKRASLFDAYEVWTNHLAGQGALPSLLVGINGSVIHLLAWWHPKGQMLPTWAQVKKYALRRCLSGQQMTDESDADYYARCRVSSMDAWAWFWMTVVIGIGTFFSCFFLFPPLVLMPNEWIWFGVMSLGIGLLFDLFFYVYGRRSHSRRLSNHPTIVWLKGLTFPTRPTTG